MHLIDDPVFRRAVVWLLIAILVAIILLVIAGRISRKSAEKKHVSGAVVMRVLALLLVLAGAGHIVKIVKTPRYEDPWAAGAVGSTGEEIRENIACRYGANSSAKAEGEAQIFNPYMPLDEYIPDGEPHVFGDRVYVYGSHDAANSTRYCIQDYVIWSAPVDDLTAWSNKGVSYGKTQDLRNVDGVEVDMYAPDCVQGSDGRYYLYYSAMGPQVPSFGPMSVAVSDYPDGPFEYLGDIQWPDGTPLTDYLTNDPAVLNDNGRIYLYYGWGLGIDSRLPLPVFILNKVESGLFNRSAEELKRFGQQIMSCVVVELADDMITVKEAPKPVLDAKTTADKNSALHEHAFYEAASIRKIGDLYYLIYSSGENHELAYATSSYPDRDFVFRGVIVSNTDEGYHGNTVPLAPGGTIHGSIENIGGQWYVFYHRCTNNTDYSRQACAEPIVIRENGMIEMAEITSCGLNGAPLRGEGSYPAAICCNLTNGEVPTLGSDRAKELPRITQEGSDTYICHIDNNTLIGYKYFEFYGDTELTVTYRGNGSGKLIVYTSRAGEALGELELLPGSDWHTASAVVSLPEGVSALYFKYTGTETADMLELEFEKTQS